MKKPRAVASDNSKQRFKLAADLFVSSAVLFNGSITNSADETVFFDVSAFKNNGATLKVTAEPLNFNAAPTFFGGAAVKKGVAALKFAVAAV